MSPAGVVVALVTAPDAEAAERLASALVEERLAACANVVPGVVSIFRWDGKVQREDEVLIVLKTTAEALPRLTPRVAELHPYDVPEVLALPVSGGLDAYLSWVTAEVGP